jgi:hypothetical protein
MQISDEAKRELQRDAQIPHLPTDLTYEARMAVEGRGNGRMARDWADKPHRVVFDLCRRIEELEAALVQMRPHIEKINNCRCVNDEMGRVVVGQTEAAEELADIFYGLAIGDEDAE